MSFVGSAKNIMQAARGESLSGSRRHTKYGRRLRGNGHQSHFP